MSAFDGESRFAWRQNWFLSIHRGGELSKVQVISATAAAPVSATRLSHRIPSIDVLRGFVMVLMALDHTRDFFTNQSISLVDPSHLSLPYFLTRWITHLCAPAFVFLAGVGARLQLARRNRTELSRFLVARGAWLVVLQFTAVYFVLIGPPGPGIFQIIGAIGLSMMLLGAMVRLPWPAGIATGAVIVGGHDLLDGVHAQALRHGSALWMLALQRGMITLHGRPALSVVYPFLPWSGLMLLGYSFGALWNLSWRRRVRCTTAMGVALLVLFLSLRSLHGYGDPNSWTNHGWSALTLTTFLNVEKYPPSLQFVAVTIGLSLLILAACEAWLARNPAGRVFRTLEVYGRVPLAFYVVHLGLIHLLAIMVCFLTGHDWHRFTTPLPHGSFIQGTPPGYGFGLAGIYLLWIAVVAGLYSPMRWYGLYKRSHAEKTWLSYL